MTSDTDTDVELRMNPYVDIHVHPEPTALPIDPASIEMITVRCPVRHDGLRIRELARDSDPALFAFFSTLVANGGEADLDSDHDVVPDLIDMGFLITEAEQITHPRYSVPVPAARQPAASPDWVVAPCVLFQTEFARPEGLPWPADFDEQEGRLDAFAPGPVLWVGDPAAIITPYWPDPDLASQLAALKAGDRIPENLAGSLAAIGAAVPPAADASPLAGAAFQRFRDLRPAFASDGFAVVRGLLPPDELHSLHAYYQELLDAGLVPFGDRQCPKRFSVYNDPVGRLVQSRYTAAFAAVAGEQLRPAFSYFFSYVDGAELLAHKDRPQAEFSISLQLAFTPEPPTGEPTGWPLRFRFDDGREHAADLALGDAVFYHGREVTHYREQLPDGCQSSVLVLEYVRSGFTGLLV